MKTLYTTLAILMILSLSACGAGGTTGNNEVIPKSTTTGIIIVPASTPAPAIPVCVQSGDMMIVCH